MICEFCCLEDGEHAIGCPCYVAKSSNYKCEICGDDIWKDDEYIVNDYGEYSHWSCIEDRKDLLDFLGYEIKKMEE